MVVVVGFLMNGANFYGYVRCKLGSKQKISSVARNFLTAQFIRSVSMTIGIFYGYPTEWNKIKMPLFFLQRSSFKSKLKTLLSCILICHFLLIVPTHHQECMYFFLCVCACVCVRERIRI